jgi:hypothetical protein
MLNRHGVHFAAIATLALCWPIHGQQRGINPPGKPPLACTATFIAGGIAQMIPTWIKTGLLTNGQTSWWQFDFPCWYDYDCAPGSVSECGMCTYVEITYLLPNGRWTSAPYGMIKKPPNKTGVCDSMTDADFTVTWGYPMDPFTPMRATLYAAPTGAACDADIYDEVYVYPFTIPPPPNPLPK